MLNTKKEIVGLFLTLFLSIIIVPSLEDYKTGSASSGAFNITSIEESSDGSSVVIFKALSTQEITLKNNDPKEQQVTVIAGEDKIAIPIAGKTSNNYVLKKGISVVSSDNIVSLGDDTGALSVKYKNVDRPPKLYILTSIEFWGNMFLALMVGCWLTYILTKHLFPSLRCGNASDTSSIETK